ncbi:enoyl-CoA hydratase/isomerase family protein, partial [Pseudorhodoferax sp.]|uniref:enoyl-CoA hydratase/isomerase family protein n=1 Tax=Pseudorhodoferax sp. TaxID=1993553 RepID=UPI0039E5CB12
MVEDVNARVANTTRHGEVLCITLANPPVNAISTAVRRELKEAVEAADADAGVQAILIVGEGANFLAGADIREFGKPLQPPSLPEVCNRIEDCGKPVVAAIRGAALGGGLEIALAAHYRVALPDAKFGLPEVQLGLMPGAGGTVRAPRLVGAQAALDLMLSGRHVKAGEAVSLGLVDRVAEGEDARAAGLAYAEELLARGAGVRRTRDAQGLADRAAAQAAIDAARAEIARKSAHLFSPMKIVEAVQVTLDKSFEEAVQLEREAFRACIDSPQRAGLI